MSSSHAVPSDAFLDRGVWIIANPVAGGRTDKRRLDEAVALLKSRLDVKELRWTGQRGDAERWAKEAASRNVGLVIGAGGDGTANEIANGLAESNTALGILPVGTANVVACEFRIPLDSVEGAKTLLESRFERIHLGYAEFAPLPEHQERSGSAGERVGRYFLFAAGLGFDAYVCLRINLRLKRLTRKVGYCLDGARIFARYRSRPMRVSLDGGEPMVCSELVACNMRAYAGNYWIAPEASAHDPHLDVCLFLRPGRWNLLRYAWGIFRGKHPSLPDVVCRKTEAVEVSSETPIYIHLDGDTLGTTPVRLAIRPDALSVLIPGK